MALDPSAAAPSPAYDALFAAALKAYNNAYAPYSRFHVGAAVLTDEGQVYAGCNVENAAYPQGQCAEASALGRMATEGGRRIVEVVVLGGKPGDGMLCTPCGGCRQRLREFGAQDLAIHVCGPEGLRLTTSLAALLPLSFGPDNLDPVETL